MALSTLKVKIVGADGEPFFQSQTNDGAGRTWRKGTMGPNDPQAQWEIQRVGHTFTISHSGAFPFEYLYASSRNDGNGRRYVHTWMKEGSGPDDPQAQWDIEKVGDKFTISCNGEYLCAAEQNDGCGRRDILIWRCDPDDPQALWDIKTVADKFIISHNGEYLYAQIFDDKNGRRYVSTWMGGEVANRIQMWEGKH